MKRINDKLLNWASILDPGTRAQACETSKMPFIQPHLALMPDAHLGKGATVGSVIPTVGAIMPAAVGVDIGCGMNAIRTQFTLDDVQATGKDLRDLHHAIASAIPLSAGNYNQTVTAHARSLVSSLESTAGIEQAEEVSPNWRNQLASLGSGNHFGGAAWTKTTECGCFCTPDPAASATVSRPSTSRSPSSSAPTQESSCRTATWPT